MNIWAACVLEDLFCLTSNVYARVVFLILGENLKLLISLVYTPPKTMMKKIENKKATAIDTLAWEICSSRRLILNFMRKEIKVVVWWGCFESFIWEEKCSMFQGFV